MINRAFCLEAGIPNFKILAPPLSLEDLQLKRCLLDSPEITSHTLKSLIVTDCTSYYDTVLAITAPALASFHLAVTTSRSNWRDIIVNEMPSIVKASILSESPVALCKLLCSLVHVGTLELYGSKTLVSFFHPAVCQFLVPF